MQNKNVLFSVHCSFHYWVKTAFIKVIFIIKFLFRVSLRDLHFLFQNYANDQNCKKCHSWSQASEKENFHVESIPNQNSISIILSFLIDVSLDVQKICQTKYFILTQTKFSSLYKIFSQLLLFAKLRIFCLISPIIVAIWGSFKCRFSTLSKFMYRRTPNINFSAFDSLIKECNNRMLIFLNSIVVSPLNKWARTLYILLSRSRFTPSLVLLTLYKIKSICLKGWNF